VVMDGKDGNGMERMILLRLTQNIRTESIDHSVNTSYCKPVSRVRLYVSSLAN
jgi:hypothetical protein